MHTTKGYLDLYDLTKAVHSLAISFDMSIIWKVNINFLPGTYMRTLCAHVITDSFAQLLNSRQATLVTYHIFSFLVGICGGLQEKWNRYIRTYVLHDCIISLVTYWRGASGLLVSHGRSRSRGVHTSHLMSMSQVILQGYIFLGREGERERERERDYHACTYWACPIGIASRLITLHCKNQ